MSIFSDIGHFVEGEVNDAEGALSKAWDMVKTVWAFLVSGGQLVWNAWEWMVNGVEWFSQQVEQWAGDTYNAVNHILFHLIPEAVVWVYKKAVHEAEVIGNEIEKWATSEFDKIRKWATRELNRIENLAREYYHDLIKLVTGPIHWVEHEGVTVWGYISHPERLAKLLVGHLIEPLAEWALKESADTAVWLFRWLAKHEKPIANLLDDVIEKIM